ncbi:MAG: hypothetical protein ABWZ88_01510 [Variovorax sp.]
MRRLCVHIFTVAALARPPLAMAQVSIPGRKPKGGGKPARHEDAPPGHCPPGQAKTGRC